MGKIKRYEVKNKYLDELKGIKLKGATQEIPVTDEDLKLLSSDVGRKIVDALIKHAKAVVSPSLYEAGNGPGLDAWMQGTLSYL